MSPINLITFYLNEAAQTLDVTFRLESDQDDEIREDFIDLQEASKFGYNFKTNLNNSFQDLFEEEELDESYFEDDENELNSVEITSFLSEYYLIYIDKLPNAELF